MSPPVDKITSTEKLPGKVDVAIVGGGIIGVSAAWSLVKRGLNVVLLEKGVIGGEQSSRNWGYCRQQGRDIRELPLTMEALRIWRGLDEEIGASTGFTQAGVCYLAGSEAEMAGFEAWADSARLYQLDTRPIGKDELASFLPDLTPGHAGALYTPGDGRAEPSKAAPAIARAVQDKGGAVMTNCAVRGLSMKAGRVAGVVTEQGEVACDAVLLAGGHWSSLFLKRHGVALPQLSVRSSVLRTSPGPQVFAGGLAAPDFAIRRRADGGYTLAHGFYSTFPLIPDAVRWMRKFWPVFMRDRKKLHLSFGAPFFEALFQGTDWSLDRPTVFEETRILDPAPDHDALDQALANMKRAFPILEPLSVEETWAGMIDATPDALPVIDGIEALPGLTLATGFSGHGFGIGPGAGRLAAQLVTGDVPTVDPTPFRYRRFFDGSPISLDEL